MSRQWTERAGLANRDARVRSGGRDWLDATGGARIRFNPTSELHLVADGDAGGGGSRVTWRAMGSATFDLSSRYGVMGGYKYLAVERLGRGLIRRAASRSPEPR